MADDTNHRERAVRELADAGSSQTDRRAECGPEPQRPSYFSPQVVRDAWIKWNLCQSGVHEDS